MKPTRLQLADTFQDMAMKMSEGNPGALNVLIMLMNEPDIDPISGLGPYGPILHMDSFNIYSHRIWMLFKDVCRQDIVAFCAMIRAVQLGILTEERLHHAIDNRGNGVNVAEVYAEVKARLGKFASPRHLRHVIDTPSQEQAAQFFLPAIERTGMKYKKIGRVGARDAVVAEKIITYTSDGKETENIAAEGDMVIRNPTGEEYIISGEKFRKRYMFVEDAPSVEGWKTYDPTGECEAAEFRGSRFDLPNPFYFTASWGERMVIKDGDMLATIDRKEVYRIARAEFDQTYQLLTGPV